MDAQKIKRKLGAILSADVEGYSRLMGSNETETVRTLTAYKEAMTDLIKQHRGRVVDAPGDNLLAEFGSVVDAVQCAVKKYRKAGAGIPGAILSGRRCPSRYKSKKKHVAKT